MAVARTSIAPVKAQRRAGFVLSWVACGDGDSRSLRRRLLAMLREAHRMLGVKRDRLGLGTLGIGGSALVTMLGAFAAVVVAASTANAGSVALGGGSATGTDSVAIDTSSSASGVRGIAIGSAATASGSDSIAQGSSANAGAQNAVAIGFGTIASGLNSLYLGSRTVAGTGALAQSAIGIGTDVTASDVDAIAVGRQSVSSTQYSVALGLRANASGPGGAMALGAGTVSSGSNSVALGVDANAIKAGDSALGTFAVANGGNSTAVGVSSTASGPYAWTGGWSSVASADSATALGKQAVASGINSFAGGSSAAASGDFAVALGNQAQALSTGGSVAIGSGAIVGNAATGGVALGNNANSGGANSVATGVSANASGANSLAVGFQSAASAASAIAIGNTAVANSANAVAMGTNATATGGQAVAIGAGNVANGNGAVALGDPSTATGNGAIASGMNNTATGDGTVAMGNTNMVGGGGQAVGVAGTPAQGAVGIGYQNTVTGQGAVGIGDRNIANGASAIAMGSQANASAANAIALGAGATATNAGSVALGNGSVTAAAVQTANTVINGNTYTFAGTTPTSTVSVGALGAERTITNVAAGRISGSSTDAINGSQLWATNQAVDAIGTTVNNITTGGGIKYFHANSTLADSSAVGTDSVAIGPVSTATGSGSVSIGNGATAANANDIALGSGSQTTTAVGTGGITIAGNAYTFAGTNPLSTVSVGSVGNERTITNVAAGRITNGSTDAVNGSQLFAATSAIDSLSTVVSNGLTHYYAVNDGGTQRANYANNGATGTNSMAAGVAASATAANATALGYNTQATVTDGVALGSGSVSNRPLAQASGTIGGTIIPYNTSDLALLGAVSVGNATSYRQIINVADGTQDSDAVTLRQLKGALTSFATTTTKYFHANSTLADSLAVGNNSVAVGPATVVNGDNGIGMGFGATVQQTAPGGIAIGQNSVSNFADSIAFGTNAQASGIQSVSIGAGSQTTNPTSVALGPNAKATAQAGDVALGANSTTQAVVATKSTTIGGTTYDFAGTAPTSTVSVGSAGAERTITNVAAGQITSTSTDAINGSQLWATNTALDSLYTTVNNISTGGGGVKYFHANSTAADSIATGAESVAIGPQSVASGANAISMGNGSAASADNSVAIGAGAKATQANSLALGANATTTANLSDAAYTPVVGKSVAGVATGEVSVGSSGAERRITNVAAGAAPTDAVNVSQLQALASSTIHYDGDGSGGTTNKLTLNSGNGAPVTISNVAPGVAGTDAVNVNQLNSAFAQLNGQIGEVRQDAWRAAAIGMAAASLRYDDRPGKLSASAGGGVWRSQGALAFGLGYTSENGRLRSNASATTAGGDWGVSAGLSLTLN
ncbi:beta strand repeat-containing protein [Bradyrhizobium sp. ORS 86]|uniref:beta strand repeat-containing protein n=1 Tax=Bradyrhizobium sp. ORS 86 TaxID=1685970 RepID=UPI00388ED934